MEWPEYALIFIGGIYGIMLLTVALGGIASLYFMVKQANKELAMEDKDSKKIPS